MRVTGVSGSGAWAYLALSVLEEPVLGGLPAAQRERLRGLLPAPLVLVRRDEEELEATADALEALAPLFRLKEPLLPAFFGEDPQGRLGAFERLHRGARIALAAAPALSAPAPSPQERARERLRVAQGTGLSRARFLERLAELGYRRVDFVEAPGEFAARGAVVDFFPVEPLAAVRALYDGDRIESLRRFDPLTQAGEADFLDEATVIPAREVARERTLGEVLGEAGAWLVEEGIEARPGRAALGLVGLPAAEQGEDAGFTSCPSFMGRIELLLEQVRKWRGEGYSVFFYSLNRGEDERVQELFERGGPGAGPQFMVGALRQGFVHPASRLAVLSSAELFGRGYRTRRGWKPGVVGRSRGRFGDLKKGDYVVHEFYGISRYLGMEAVREPAPLTPEGEPGGSVMDCLKLEFRGGDALFIPMTDFRLVQKYIGAEGHRPRLSSLDTRNWNEVKERVKEGVRELAQELLKTQAARAAAPGHAFSPDSRMEEEFAESFPFEETPDQARAIAEVKADMTAPHPMDRVVVGDVGFGKTEVAMRAALKCAADLRQTAVLVPTTILADQHSRNFRRRFAEYPVRVETLSRFVAPSEQRRVLAGVAAGKVDIVIGTHRLLQPDVRFKDLGLLVIDEEHRFGVKDKERLKSLKKTVDCLTLSATPIPRTLHQALSGLRAVSLIQSPPAGRQPIVTAVRPFDEGHVASAISEELGRGGQVFYVHNRVRSLPERLRSLETLLPSARFRHAHGQMRSDVLEKTMWDFFNRKFDVLVASSIIESGLDIPSVNTLLIENAQDFGLSSLYQLRGRIGRERQRAYCYLYYPGKEEDLRVLSEDARKRLEALREFTELGSGFALAMRDLEIRGAGDLLGAQQHGFMNSVGVEFYSDLLESEIKRLSGRAAPAEKEEPVQLDLSLPAHIPESYLPGDLERIQFYKRILAAKPEAIEGLKKELRDLSGPLPSPVENLFSLLRVRSLAAAARIRAVVQRGSRVEVYFRTDAPVPTDAIARWMSAYEDRLEFIRSPEGDGVRVLLGAKDPLKWLEDFLQGLGAASARRD